MLIAGTNCNPRDNHNFSGLSGRDRNVFQALPESPEILRLFERMSSVNRRNEWQSKGTLCVNGQNELKLIKIFFSNLGSKQHCFL